MPGEPDPVLAAAVDTARAAVESDAGVDAVGDHVGVHAEPGAAATHLFQALEAGYVGWRWAVTLAHCGPGEPVTVSEIVLLPGPEALVAPEWLPWHQRVRAGDLGPGDLLPPAADDHRLVPGYVGSDDADLEDHAVELGLGRTRVMSRQGRLEAAARWRDGDFGPGADMARQAPGNCGTCGFYLPVAGSLRAAFGVCGNEFAPADGRAVHAEYGCGAHSEAEVESVSPVPVAGVVYDDGVLEINKMSGASVDQLDGSDTVQAEADVPDTKAPPVGSDVSDAGASDAGAARSGDGEPDAPGVDADVADTDLPEVSAADDQDVTAPEDTATDSTEPSE